MKIKLKIHFLCGVFGWQVAVCAAPLSFLEALKTLSSNSPSVQAQKEIWEATKAKNVSSHLYLLPSLSLSGSHAKENSFGSNTERTGVELSLQQNIFRFGADSNANHLAALEEEIQEEKVNDTILNVEAEGSKALALVIQRYLEAETLKRLTQIYQESFQIAEERYKKGILPNQEVEKISIDLENALARLRDAELTLGSEKAALSALLPAEQIQLDWPWKGETADKILATALANVTKYDHRPDWRIAQKRVESADRNLNQHFSKLFPSLDLTFGYGYFSTLKAERYTGPEWRGMVTLSVPLFDRFSNYGNYRSQEHLKRAAIAEREKLQRHLVAETEAVREATPAILSTAKLREKTLGTSRRLYQDNLLRFQKGVVNANELNVDQTRLYESELLAIRGWASFHQQIVQLCHSQGKSVLSCLTP